MPGRPTTAEEEVAAALRSPAGDAGHEVYEGDDEDYVFVSYAHRDSEIVVPAIRALQGRGLRVWYDWGIEAGSEWPDYIADHLDACRCFLAFVSRAANESYYCRCEINRAIEREKDKLVVYLEDEELSPGMEMHLGILQKVRRSGFETDEAFHEALAGARLLEPCRSAG